MKRLFSLIGLLIGVQLIFVFLLYANTQIYPEYSGSLQICSLEQSIDSERLTNLAERNNITTFTVEYKNSSFINQNIIFHFLYINDDDDIAIGAKNSLIPTNSIIYERRAEESSRIQRFWIINNDEVALSKFAKDLEEFHVVMDTFYTHEMSFADILSKDNIDFLFCLLLLIVFSISAICILRGKEVAVMKLSGYKDYVILFRILKNGCKRVIIAYSFVGVIFLVYVIINDRAIVGDFVKLFGYMTICILLVLAASCLAGIVFTRFMGIIAALKGNISSKYLVILIATFKILATFMIMISVKDVWLDYLTLKVEQVGKKSAGTFCACYLNTSESPDEATMKDLLTIFENVDNKKIYNYAEPTNYLYGYEALIDHAQKDNMYDNPPFVNMSYNMLDYIHVYTTRGDLISQESCAWDGITLLIPEHLSHGVERIINGFSNEATYKVRFIQSNQEHYSLLYPMQKAYNVIYVLSPVQKNIYANNGYVFFDNKIKSQVETILNEAGIDEGSVSLRDLETHHETIENTLVLKLFHKIKKCILNMFSYAISLTAIAVVFFEYRKKELAVYRLLSVNSSKPLIHLCGVNTIVTLLVGAAILPAFGLFCVFENFIYAVIFHFYLKRRVVYVLKGE